MSFTCNSPLEDLVPSADKIDRVAACCLLENPATKLNEILTTHDIATSVQTLTLRCYKTDLCHSNTTLISNILHPLPQMRNFTFEFWDDLYSVYPSFSLTGDFTSAISSLVQTSKYHNIGPRQYHEFFLSRWSSLCAAICEIFVFGMLHLVSFAFFLYFRNNSLYIPVRLDENSTQLLSLDSLDIDGPTVDNLSLGIFKHLPSVPHFSQINNLRFATLFLGDSAIMNPKWIL
jgi:hypothetical protein